MPPDPGPPISNPQGLLSENRWPGDIGYCETSWNFAARGLCVRMSVSLWNLTGGSVAGLPRRLSNFRTKGKLYPSVSRLRDLPMLPLGASDEDCLKRISHCRRSSVLERRQYFPHSGICYILGHKKREALCSRHLRKHFRGKVPCFD